MIIRYTPTEDEINNYIVADNDLARELQRKGFIAKYIDKDYLYFEKTDEILQYLVGW